MGIERALVSVSDREGLSSFVGFLRERGVEVVATGGTAAHLAKAGLEVAAVETLPGVSGLLGGRVKTLTPTVFAGILADRSDAGHIRELEAAGIRPIDLVAVNLYPFEAALGDGAALARLVEEIDVGGVALARAAAKNHAHVTVATRPAHYAAITAALDEAGDVPLSLRRRLAHEAFLMTSRYEATIARGLAAAFQADGDETPLFPATFAVPAAKQLDLRYGENHHQRAALYRDAAPAPPGEIGVVDAEQLAGKPLSYNNVLDADQAIGAVREFTDPTLVIIKHATPSGVASANDLKTAWEHAFQTDTYSPFGSVVAANRTLDLATAEAMRGVFLELVLAPGFEPAARKLLARRKNLRLLVVPGLDTPYAPLTPGAPPVYAVRGVRGGLLVQEEDRRAFDPASWRTVTKRRPTDGETASLLFAARVVKHVRSNALVFAKGTRTVGIGGGQTARVDASWIACHKGGENIRGSVMASDAFFPFRDAVDVAAENGVAAIVQPGGSIRDDEVVAACDDHGIAMVMTGHRLFHH